MLQYARYRGAGGWMRAAHAGGQAFLYRAAPLPAALRRVSLESRRARLRPGGARPGDRRRCCARRRRSTSRHMTMPRVSVADRLALLRGLLAAAAAVLVRRGGRGRRPRDGRGDAVRAAGAVQARRGRLGAGRAVRRRSPCDARSRRAAARAAAMTSLARAASRRCCSSSPDPVAVDELADALRRRGRRARGAGRAAPAHSTGRGVVLREVAGGWALASHPDAEEAARRLLASPRTPALTPAQAETLAIVGYLQPVSRPEIARIRGVASESATAALVERGLIEEAGRSQFGAVLYRTTPLFLRLFGLESLDDLPDVDRSGTRRPRTRRRCATGCCGRRERGATPAAARRRRRAGRGLLAARPRASCRVCRAPVLGAAPHEGRACRTARCRLDVLHRRAGAEVSASAATRDQPRQPHQVRTSPSGRCH